MGKTNIALRSIREWYGGYSKWEAERWRLA